MGKPSSLSYHFLLLQNKKKLAASVYVTRFASALSFVLHSNEPNLLSPDTFQRMASPIGRNAQWCCDTVGLSLYNMCLINKDLVSHCAFSSLPDWVVTSVGVMHELLQVRWNCTCLQLLNLHELDFIIDVLATG